MIVIENKIIQIQITKNGDKITITDKHRNNVWIHDCKSMQYKVSGDPEYRNMKPVRADRENNIIRVVYKCGDDIVAYEYHLLEDCVEVRLQSHSHGTGEAFPMPGSFNPVGNAKKYLLPIMQGVLWDTRGEAFDTTYREAAHVGFSMAMFGCTGEKGALLLTAETSDDCVWRVGKDITGRSWAVNMQTLSLGTIRYERVVRLYMTNPDITAVAKCYRARVIERGRFKSWEEKLNERPALERLFGALMCFVGYCQDDIDYVKECEKLKNAGFDRILLYPVRFNSYSKNFLMGGFPPIDLSREVVDQIKQLGIDVAPWTWISEGLDDHSENMRKRYRITAMNDREAGWQIDEQRWYQCCTGPMPVFQKQSVESDFDDMTWDHFDVITCVANNECYALDHESHPGKPLSRTDDRKFIRQLLMQGQAAARAVSSESFNDAYSMEYDMGSVKMWPQYGPWEFWPIPLTLLVFHDSMLHTWWEPHNYNCRYFNRDCKKYQYGGGRARSMAAMDALYGCVPDVFPFGAMYGWTGNDSETFLYKMRLEDPETQFALALAKPVAELHRKIGKLEMTEFEIISNDGYLQRTKFADGTTVYANFAAKISGYIDGIGALQPESWCVAEPESLF